MNGDRPRPAETRESWIDRLLTALHLRHPVSIRDDIEDALAQTSLGSDLSPTERIMLHNVLSLRERRVDDAMVPRADIIAVAAEASLGDVLGVFRTAGHSRLPVYGETLDDPRGMVHIRDFVDFLAARADAASLPTARKGAKSAIKAAANLAGIDLALPLESARILRPVLFVPPSMGALDLLVKMQATRTHMALVIDEYGGTDGLVSIEDLVEMVVGDIEDEHDVAEGPLVQPGEGGTFVADARASLEEAAVTIGADLAEPDIAEEIDTIGGLVVTLAGRVPARGELIKGTGGIEYEVLDADPRRLKRVRIHRRTNPEAAARRRSGRRDAETDAASSEASSVAQPAPSGANQSKPDPDSPDTARKTPS